MTRRLGMKFWVLAFLASLWFGAGCEAADEVAPETDAAVTPADISTPDASEDVEPTPDAVLGCQSDDECIDAVRLCR